VQRFPELRELRVFLFRHGVTQEQLADAIGLSRVAISNAITGKSEPKLSTVNHILAFCKKLDRTIDYERLFARETGKRAA